MSASTKRNTVSSTANPVTICGARTRSGGRCRVPPMAAGRCYRHGGASKRWPVGQGPRYTHGQCVGLGWREQQARAAAHAAERHLMTLLALQRARPLTEPEQERLQEAAHAWARAAAVSDAWSIRVREQQRLYTRTMTALGEAHAPPRIIPDPVDT